MMKKKVLPNLSKFLNGGHQIKEKQGGLQTLFSQSCHCDLPTSVCYHAKVGALTQMNHERFWEFCWWGCAISNFC